MRILRKRVLACKDEDKQLPLVTFKHSLRNWNSQWKAQRTLQTSGLRNDVSTDDNSSQGRRLVHG